MTTFNLVVMIVGAIVLVGLVVLGRVFGRAYLKYRGDRVITCPENRRPAGVVVDAGHVLLTALEGKPDLRLKSCSQWPERQNCGQECLRQIVATPEDCLVSHMLTHWYQGKTCALCDKPIGEIHWADNEPAMLNTEHRTVEWHEVRAADVPDVVNRIAGEHPELVVNQSRHI